MEEQWGFTIPAGGPGAQYVAELRILLVYLSESLGRLGQNWGEALGASFLLGGHGPLPPVEPPLPRTEVGKRFRSRAT